MIFWNFLDRHIGLVSFAIVAGLMASLVALSDCNVHSEFLIELRAVDGGDR